MAVYVNEFSRRLGIPASKVRYYDRIGLYQGERYKNNYRNYTDSDALDVYFARSLRSVDMSVKETLYAIQNYDHGQLLNWLDTRSDELEAEIAQTKAKLERLQKMYQRSNAFFEVEGKVMLWDMLNGQKTYSICTFGDCAKINEEILDIAAVWGECMPYTYISVKIPEESLLGNEEDLSVGIGLGVVEENMERCGLDPSEAMDCFPGGPCLVFYLERENIFELKRSDIQPIFDEAKARGVRIVGDASGRVPFSGNRDGKRYYALSLRCQIEPTK